LIYQNVELIICDIADIDMDLFLSAPMRIDAQKIDLLHRKFDVPIQMSIHFCWNVYVYDLQAYQAGWS